MEVEVIYPYNPQQDDELELHVGDIVNNVVYLEKGWYKGVLNNVSGAFPDNFVRIIGSDKSGMTNAGNSSLLGFEHVENAHKVGGIRQCRATFSYKQQHEDELSLREGDILTVLEEVEEGWWKGNLNGVVGMFPSNFVEEIGPVAPPGLSPSKRELNGNSCHATDVNDSVSTLQHSNSSPFKPVQGIKENGSKKIDSTPKNSVTDYIKSRLPSQVSPLGPQNQETPKATRNVPAKVSHENGIKVSMRSPPVPSPPELPPKPVRDLARVLFAYEAEHDDELDLKEGDLVTVLSKDLEDRGWWKGELNNRIGVFPDNFVQLVSSHSSHEEVPVPPRPEKGPERALGKTSEKKHIIAKGSESPSPLNVSSSSIKEATPPPPLPGKKVSQTPPPPTQKKPTTPSKNSTPRSNGKTKVSENGSLTIGRESPLTHLTRPKGPSNRRPPSQLLKEKKKSVGESGDDLSSSMSDSAESVIPASPVSKPSPNRPHSQVINGSSLSNGSKESNEAEPPWLKEHRVNKQKRNRLRSGSSSSSVPGQLDNSLTTSPRNSFEKTSETLPSSDMKPSMPSKAFTPANEAQSKDDCPSRQEEASNMLDVTEPDLNVKPKIIDIKPKPVFEKPKTAERELSKSERKDSISRENKSSESVHHGDPETNKEFDEFGGKNEVILSKFGKKTSEPQRVDLGGMDSVGEPWVVVDGDGGSAMASELSLEEKMDALERRFSSKVLALEQRLEDQKVQHSRQIQILIKELDDERKQRACLAIEVDRLTKLLQGSTFAQV